MKAEASLSVEGYDGIILVADSLDKLTGTLDVLRVTLEAQATIGKSILTFKVLKCIWQTALFLGKPFVVCELTMFHLI